MHVGIEVCTRNLKLENPRTHRERERGGLAGGYRFDDLSVNELVGERKVEG